jgi:hypothetical protein
VLDVIVGVLRVGHAVRGEKGGGGRPGVLGHALWKEGKAKA